MATFPGLRTGKSAVLLAIAFSGTLFAGRNQWTSVGPEGGNVLALAADPQNPSTLYAATCGGVFKTIDAGASWTATNVALPTFPCDQGAESLVVDPQNTGTVYAVSGNQIFKTTDGGARWSAISTLKATQVLTAPSKPNTLYASDGKEIFKSADGGATWAGIVDSGVPGSFISLLAVDPQNPDTLYGFFPGGFSKSTDGGFSWSPANSGLPACPGACLVLHLAIDAQNPDTLYAASFGQIFKSTDGAASWNPAILGLPPVPQGQGGFSGIDSLAVSPKNPAVIFALISQGGTFNPLSYYVGISQDGAASWTTVTLTTSQLSFACNCIPAITPDPGDTSTLYLGTGDGILKTTDGGGHWNPANAGLRAAGIGQLVVDSQAAGTLYVVSYQLPNGPAPGLLKSTDGGNSWFSSSSGLTQDFGSLVADPQDSRTLYIMASECSPCGPGPNGRGLFKSQDAGGSWTEIYRAPLGMSLLAPVPQFPNVLYADTGYQLAKSSDGGYTWIQSQTALPQVGCAFVSAIVLDPQDSNTVYVGTQDSYCQNASGLWKSVDAGMSWTELPGTSFDIGAAVADPRNPGTVYFLDINRSPALHKSADGGQTWTRTPLPDCCLNPILVADPQNSGTLYYSSGLEVFRSADAGASWKSLGSGLRGVVYSLALDPQDPQTLYAGSTGGLFAIHTGRESAFPHRPIP